MARATAVGVDRGCGACAGAAVAAAAVAGAGIVELLAQEPQPAPVGALVAAHGLLLGARGTRPGAA